MTDSRTMTASDGVQLSYRVRGSGDPVVLIHGFLVDADLNWIQSGVADHLVAAGHRVVLPDARGHGRSDKPHDAGAYRVERLVRDVTELLDELQIDRAALVGYSMGADTAARVAASEPARVDCLVLGGVGGDLADPVTLDRPAVARQLRDGRGTGDGLGASLSSLARALAVDVDAAAALFEGIGPLAAPDYDAVTAPVLVITGSEDEMAGGDPAALAARFPTGAAWVLPGHDHLGAVFDPAFASEVASFLTAR